MPHSQTLHFPTNFSPDLVLLKYFTFIPSHTHSLFTLTSTIYLFTDSHNHFFFKFSFKTLKQTQFICNVTTTRMTWTPMNKNESARNYIQFSSCDSLQKRVSCRDELYKTSRQRWCDKLDVCLHPSSGDTFLSTCQLLQLDRGNNRLEHHRCRSVDVLVLVLHSHQNRPAQRIPVNEYTY